MSLEKEYKPVIITELIPYVSGKYAQLAEAAFYAINPDTARTKGGVYLDVRAFGTDGKEWRRWLDLEKRIVFPTTEENMRTLTNIKRLIGEERILAMQIRGEIERLKNPILPENVAEYFPEQTLEEMREIEGI